MTTEQQTTPEGEWVPRYFSDFRKEFDVFKDENVRQHVQLGERIGALEVDTARQFGEVKADIESKFGELRTDMEARFGRVDREFGELKADMEARFGRIDREFGEIKAQMADDKAEMHRALASQLRWMIGTTAGVGIAVVTSVVYLAERLA